MARKKKAPTRLFKADASYTEEAKKLQDRLDRVVEEFIQEMPDVDLNDVLAVAAFAGRMQVAKAIMVRRHGLDLTTPKEKS
jgi:hypothetical protein